MSRNIVLALMAAGVLLAGCQGESVGEFAHQHKVGLIGGGVGAGVGALAGRAIGHSTASTLLGAAVGGGIGYLLGNTQDKKRAERYDWRTPTPLTGSYWRVQRLSMPNPPTYREMYLSFAPNSQLVTTQVLPDGRVIQASETYRIADHTLIINRPAEGGQQGYIINADYNISGNTMTISSPDFSAECERVNQIPVAPPMAAGPQAF
ncbi:MAG: glycine zipper domain-containing protein [Planctomycetes bacterium]|nr:glycine zipper domain-containing protein [Planctomycetota bacterium]